MEQISTRIYADGAPRIKRFTTNAPAANFTTNALAADFTTNGFAAGFTS